ncbi:MAG: protein kinase, partial [Candidatus Riflebacteria bacterium]|nr:protein kinase [Candidatus Riflebacteria bacterium]
MEIGHLIGRFRVSRQIGKGGMGNVYLALDTVNFRQVAVKVLPRVFQASSMLIARFLREMEVCRRLSHPNIVGFIEAGLDKDQYYLAQEFIVGTSLEELVSKRGTLSKELALSIMQDASYALHAVHQQKIVHRDIKLQNIMVSKEMVIKLIDFGIALARDERIQQSILAELDRVGLRYRTSDLKTQPGTVIGTPCYNSPEQNQAKEVTFAADIYSLGLVFYEMFTGVQVLPNTTLAKIIDFQSELDNQLIPVSQVNPDSPAGIDEIISKMIRYRPDERFQTASELVLAIKKLGISVHGTEEASEGGKQGKRLAQLELFETYYWKAMNLLNEHGYIDALTEFDSLLSLQFGEGQYKSAIEESVNFLCWVLKPMAAGRQATQKGKGKSFRVPLEEYIHALMKIMSIYSKLGLDGQKQLAQKKFVKAVEEIDEYDRALEFYDKIFADFPQDTIIKRGYAMFLYGNGAISAGRCAQFDIVKQHYAERNFEAAFEELQKVLKYEESNEQVQEEMAQLKDLLTRRAAEKETFIKKLES